MNGLGLGAALAILSILVASTSEPGRAQYPTRPITLVVASAPGGPADIYARLVSDKMSSALGQRIVIENVSGSGGIIGAARVARADPDGYTLLIHQTGISIARALTPNLPYDVAKDFAVVGLINETHALLIGRKDLPASTFPDLIEWMKGPGKPAKVAHPGKGSLGHLVAEMIGKHVGAEINAVPYRGIAPAINDLLGGHVDLLWGSAGIFAPLANEGKVKAYVYSGSVRSHLAPNIPASSELSVPAIMSVPIWHALFVPAGTPKPVVESLNAALRKGLADPVIAKTFHDDGSNAFPEDMQSPEAGDTHVRRELARWHDVVRTLQLK